MRATSLLLTGTVALAGLLACARPNQHGRRAQVTDASAPPHREPGQPAPVPAPMTEGSSAPAPQTAPAPEGFPLPMPGGSPPPDAAAPADAAAAGPVECTPGVRACLPGNPRSARRCSDTGHWTEGPACALGTSCSGGACVCDEGACEDRVVLELPGRAEELVGGGPFLHFVQRPGGDASPPTIHSLDTRNDPGAASLVETGGHELLGLAADAGGALYWCRYHPLMEAIGDLMKGTTTFDPGLCQLPVIGDRHVYFSIGNPDGLFRRALDRPGRQRVFATAPLGMAVTSTHVYLSTFPLPGNSVFLVRIPVDQLTPVQMLGRRAFAPGRIFHEIAVDDTHVYLAFVDQVLRIPREGGDSFEDFWSHRGPEIEAIRLTDTHVYWLTVSYGLESCVESAVWRRSKLRDDRAVLLARRAGICSGGLAIAGDHLYTAFYNYPGPSQVVRLRR